MTIFLTGLLSILVFAVTSVVVGSIWFYVCIWNEAWRVRDFRILVIAIPITFFLGHSVVGSSPTTEVAAPTPSPVASPKPVKKRKKKVIKKEEDDSQVELPQRLDDDGNPINQDGEGEQ